MGKVICPEPGVQMTVSSFTIDPAIHAGTPTIRRIVELEKEVCGLREALATARADERERCARLCEAVVRVPVGDGTYHEMYTHLGNKACAEAIRAGKKDG